MLDFLACRLFSPAPLGLGVMAASDVPAVALGATDPSTWGRSGWLSDLAPHLTYGMVTALGGEGRRD